MKVNTFIVRRILLLVPVMVGVTMLTFGLMWAATDGHLETQYAGPDASPAALEATAAEYGFDKPLVVQYLYYLYHLARGDMGLSASQSYLPVTEVVAEFFPATLELALVSMLIALAAGVPLGVFSATHHNSAGDGVLRVAALSGVSVPVFWLGILLQYLVAFKWGLLPLQGRFTPQLMFSHPVLANPGPTGLLLVDTLIVGDWVAFKDVARHLVLPATSLAFVTLAIIVRMMRASMLDALGTDYVRTAVSKGLPHAVVVRRHARRNALIPTITVVGLAFGALLGGAVLVETVFNWPGLGRWAVKAFVAVDAAAIVGFTLFITVVYVLVNLAVDVLYVVLDPRVRMGSGQGTAGAAAAVGGGRGRGGAGGAVDAPGADPRATDDGGVLRRD